MYHKIIIVGNLGRDPEMRYSPSGQAVTNFSVASNRQYKGNDGQQVKQTIWFRISVWGNQAEACNQYLKKGSKVLVEGRMNPDSETGSPSVFERKDGSHGASYEVTAQTVRFLSTRGEGDEVEDVPSDDDNIPF
ncbi:MAG: single-stranded DNA-binding protein [Chloroflexota bacterium]